MESHVEQGNVSILAPPISRLSQDILSDIFLLVATDRPSVSANRRAKSIASFSQVSRQWREAVLDYPSLWSYVIDYHESVENIKHRLGLCGNALLEFGYRSNPVFFVSEEDEFRGCKVLKLIFRYATDPGLRSFNFCGLSRSWSIIGSRFLRNAAPQLKYLGLREFYRYSPNYLIGTALFNDQAPALRTIYLDGCVLQLELSPRILGNLCELQVKNFHRHPKAPNLYQWIGLLDLLPELRWLTIVNSISPSEVTVSRPSKSIRFDRLKILYLRASPSDYATLLHVISLSATCGIRIEAEITKHAEDLHTLCNLMSQRIQPSLRALERHWTIQCFPPQYNRATLPRDYWLCFMNRDTMQSETGAENCPGWDSPDDGAIIGAKDPFVYVLFLFLEHLESEMPPALELLLQSFTSTYPSTTSLTVSFRLTGGHRPPMVDPQAIANRLHLFKQMKTLELYDENFSQHQYFTIPEDSSNPESIPMPCLRHIQIGSSDGYDYPPSFFEFLRWRKAHGMAIHEITLTDVVVDKRGVESKIGDAVDVIDMDEAWDPNEEDDMDDLDGDDDDSDVDIDDSDEDDDDWDSEMDRSD